MPTSQLALRPRGETQIYWLVIHHWPAESVLMIKIQWHSLTEVNTEAVLPRTDSGSIVLLSGLTRVEEKSDMTALFPRYDTLGHQGEPLGTTATYWDSDQEIQILSRRDLLLLLPPPATTEIWHSKNLKPNCQGWSLDIRIICPAIWNIKALERETFHYLTYFGPNTNFSLIP